MPKLKRSDAPYIHYETGYFGIPGKTGGQVHVVRDIRGVKKPICGASIHPKAEFQWCAHYIVITYVECKRCQERAMAILDKCEEERALRNPKYIPRKFKRT